MGFKFTSAPSKCDGRSESIEEPIGVALKGFGEEIHKNLAAAANNSNRDMLNNFHGLVKSEVKKTEDEVTSKYITIVGR